MELSEEYKKRCKVIGEINTMLMFYDKNTLTSEDFDILYEYSSEELRQVKKDIRLRILNDMPALRSIRT